jgi:hypothetical protein
MKEWENVALLALSVIVLGWVLAPIVAEFVGAYWGRP